MATRTASVAGAFYPPTKEALLQQVRGFFQGLEKEEKSSCVVAPHAGYVYSGRTAAYAFNALQESKTFVLLGPNHSGLGPAISISDADSWETPLGEVAVDRALREKLLAGLEIDADDLAHMDEHSLEVQIPFLQHLFKGFSILPVTIMEHRLPELVRLGNALAAKAQGSFSVIASSDFSHFVPLEKAREKDFEAIKRIEALDIEGFYKTVVSQELSICGFSAITAAMQYCRQKGFKAGKLLHYDTSATASGDKGNVVGYAAIKLQA